MQVAYEPVIVPKFFVILGGELFFFTLDSPPWSSLVILSVAVLLVKQETFSKIFGTIVWRHKDVAWAIGETILMAFIGTFGGAIIALPLAFGGEKFHALNEFAIFHAPGF